MPEASPAVTAAREQFLAQVREWAVAVDDDTTESADAINKCVTGLRKWIAKLDEKLPSVAHQVLSEFMTDDDPATRYMAAALMASHGAEEQALTVIQEIADNDDYGTVSSTAKTSLWMWRRKKAKERAVDHHNGTE